MNNSYMPNKATVSKPNKIYKHRMANFAQTSAPFMQSSVLFKKWIKGNSKLPVNYDAFIRCDALPQPTMGLANCKLNWFYVPCRIIYPNYNEFMTQTLIHGDKSAFYAQKVPTFDINSLWDYCYTNNSTLQLFTIKGRIDQDAPSPYVGSDYDCICVRGTQIYALKYTYKGFCMFNLFHQLGYQTPGVNVQETHVYKSAMPLLAYAKIILDYYIPKQWRDFEYIYNTIYYYFNLTTDSAPVIQTTAILDMLSLVFYVAFDNDFNTEAWTSPAGPNWDNTYPTNSYSELLADDNSVYASSLGAQLNLDDNSFTQEDLNHLKAMDMLLKKNQIVGVKSWDRLMARFGIKTDKALLKVPEILESIEIPIVFNEVVSTAETASSGGGANLGSLAGKAEAFINEQANFNYYTEEDGFLFCIATIVPETGYANYEDEDVNAIEFLDYWNNEYDGQLTQPALVSNVLNTEMGLNTGHSPNHIWGWYPAYYWMKVTKPRISGKYSLYSRKAENKGWSFLRWVDGVDLGIYQNSLNFGIGTNLTGNSLYAYRTQFDDIFYYPAEHNFNIFFTHSILMTNTMKPLWDYDLFDDEDDEKEYKVSVQNHE